MVRHNGKRILRAVCFWVLCCLVIAGLPFAPVRTAHAGELEDKQQELDEVNKRIEQMKKAIAQKQGQEKSLTAELKNLEKALDQAQKDLKYLEARTQATQTAIDETEASIKETEASLASRKDLLMKRLQWLYKAGPMGYVEVILGARDIQEVLSRFEMIRAIVEQDVALAKGLKQDKQELEEQKAALEERKSQLSSLKSQTAAKREQVSSRAAERNQFLTQITKERSQYEKALDELEELSEQLVSVIRELQAKQSYKPGGPLSMIWPAKGPVTSQYGMRVHPILKTNRMHSGIDIGAARGTNILAAESGIVLSAGLLGGYGNAVIIDHGNGVSTLYGHADSLLVSAGQTVIKGNVIGKVGSTGLATGPHLHFEVRVNGATKNPLSYLK